MASYTLTELLELERAIATGVRRVRHADGREVEYRSLADMRSLAETMRRSLGGESPGLLDARYVVTRKDLG